MGTAVVEPAEVAVYEAVTDPKYGTVLPLDMDYQTAHDTCDELGDTNA